MITDKNEMIEAYLSNKLPQSEVATFEAELAKDPALQNEVALQKDIITTLQNSRKIELKNRLSAIDVNHGLSNSQKLGITAIALSSLLLLTFGIYQIDREEKTLPETAPESTKTMVTIPEPKDEVLNPASTPVTESIVAPTEVTPIETVENTSPRKNSKEPIAPTEATQKTPEERLTLPTPLEFEAEGSGITHDNVNAPEDQYSDNERNEIHAITPKIDNKDKKVRMYKYDGENLTLIGNFNSAEPYHLIESSKNSVTELYLMFENTYYAIKETKKAVELEEVTDSKLITELSKK